MNAIIVVLCEAWQKFDSFPPERQYEIARWVHRRVNELQERGSARAPVPQSFVDREPGEEG